VATVLPQWYPTFLIEACDGGEVHVKVEQLWFYQINLTNPAINAP
jgi:hypothetical protein